MRSDSTRDNYDLEALEPRLLLSADPIATLLDTDDQSREILGDSVSVALMQSTVSESITEAAEDDFFDGADEPLVAAAEPLAAETVSADTTKTVRVLRVSEPVTATESEPLAMESQTKISAQSIVVEQQVTSLNIANGPPEYSALSGPVAPGTYADLLTFITETLNSAASGDTISDTYTFSNDLALGSVFTIENASVTFAITVSGASGSLVYNGTVSITAGEISLTLGSLASAAVTDGSADGIANGLTATYTLANATATGGGTFDLTLDQVTLTAFDGVLSATGSNFTLTYSAADGLQNSDLNFNPVTIDLNAGAAGSDSNVINATGSGLVQITDAGIAAAVDLTLSSGPAFAGQSIVLLGNFKLRLNTTGAAVTSIGGVMVDLPSPGGATYLKVMVENASLTISGAVLVATELTFEKAGDVITVTGVGVAFTLNAGTTQIVKATSDAFAMQFTGGGFVAAVTGAAVAGPALANFSITGVVDFLVNTTGAAVALPGPVNVPGVANGVYVLATVRGATVGVKASLTVSQSVIEATALTFEMNTAGVAFAATDLSIELRAGAKRILGISGASAAFQFVQDGFYGAINTASVVGPDFFDGATPLFALAGVVSLRINSTTTSRSILVGGVNVDIAAGAVGQAYIYVSVANAQLTVVGSTLSATTLTFQQSDGVVEVAGTGVSFELKAGSKRIVGVSNATFAMRFTPAGFVAGVRGAEVAGPDFGGTFGLVGTVDLDINTTGADVTLPVVGLIPGVSGSTYISASVTGAVLTVAGSTLSAATLTFVKAGSDVTVTGTTVGFELKAGSKRIVGVENATFAMLFTSAGFVAGVRGAQVVGPDFGTTFGLEGTVDLDINTTGADVTLPVVGLIAGAVGTTYIRASITNGVLTALGSEIKADTLTFERTADGIAVGGTGLSVELKAGATRILKLTSTSFGFVFIEAGMYGGVLDATVDGPDFGGQITVGGKFSLLLNTTGTTRSISLGGTPFELPVVVPGTAYVRVEATEDTINDEVAGVTIAGSGLTAEKLVFEQQGSTVTLSGTAASFQVNAGATSILNVSVEEAYLSFGEEGFVGAIKQGQVSGPQFDGFKIVGTVNLQINTTGTVAAIPLDLNGNGSADDSIQGNVGGIYLKASVSNAEIEIGDNVLLSAVLFEFEWSEDGVALDGIGVSFKLSVGAKQIVELSGASFSFRFTDAGYYGAVIDGTLFGPDIDDFTLAGTASFQINTTLSAQSVTVGPDSTVISLLAGTAQSPFLRVEVAKTGEGEDEKAKLVIGGSQLAADKLVFQLDDGAVTLSGEGLFFELKAGDTRILSITVAAFSLRFDEDGFVGAVVDAEVTGPSIANFTLSGRASLLINTTGVEQTVEIDINGDGVVDAGDTVEGNADGLFLYVEVTESEDGTPATFAIQGAVLLSANLLTFTYSETGIAFSAESLTFQLQAGSKRIFSVTDADFAFQFTSDGFYGGVIGGEFAGPDIEGFDLEGSLSFLINTTTEAQSIDIPGQGATALTAGTSSTPFIFVEVSATEAGDPARFEVAGSGLSADWFLFTIAAGEVTVAAENLEFVLMAGSKRILRIYDATFGLRFTAAGMVLGLRNAAVEGPDFGTAFTLTGRVDLDLNTTGADVVLPVDLNGDGSTDDDDFVPGSGDLYLNAVVRGIDDDTPAMLAVAGLTLTAEYLSFEYNDGDIAILGTGLGASLVVGGDTIFDATAAIDFVFESATDTFRINSAVLTLTSGISIGSFITIGSPSVELENLVVTADGTTTGILRISATSVSLFEGKPFSASVVDREDTAETGDTDLYALTGEFDLGTGAFELTLDDFTLAVSDAFIANAQGVVISYDPTIVGSQQLVEIDSGTLTLPKLGNVQGTLQNLIIRTDGFSLDLLEIYKPGTTAIGSLISVTELRVTFTDFAVDFGNATNITGTISVAVDDATLFPGKPVSATAEDLTITFSFVEGDFAGLQFTAGTLSLSIGTFLTFTATDVALDTEAGDDDFVVSFASITGTLTAGSFVVSATGENFGITGAGDFRVLEGEEFSVSLSFGANTANGLKWPSFLPIDIQNLELKWDDFENDPLDFSIELSATITGLFGQTAADGLTFTGMITGLVIDVGLLADGKFPITQLAELGVFVSGPLFGGQVEVGLSAGIVKVRSSGPDIGDVLAPDAEGDDVEAIFYVALIGGFTMPGVGGVSMRVAFSDRGPLQFYIEADIPIVLEPFAGLTLAGLRGGVQFGTTIAEPADAFALRNSAFGPPGDVPFAQWVEALRQQIGNQVELDISFDDPASLFENGLVFSAGADLYSSYASELTFRAEVDLIFDTSGKIIINANTVFGDKLNAKTYLYGDLTQIQSGEARFLFLVDLPEKVGELDPLMSIYGELQFETITDLADGSNAFPLTLGQLNALGRTDVATDSFTVSSATTTGATFLLTADRSEREDVKVLVNGIAYAGTATVGDDARTVTLTGTFAQDDVVTISYKVDGAQATDSFDAAVGETLKRLELSQAPVIDGDLSDAAAIAALINLTVTFDAASADPEVLVYGVDYTLNPENWTVVLTGAGRLGASSIDVVYDTFVSTVDATGPPPQTVESFRIIIAGGATFTLPGDLAATVTGEIILSFNSERFKVQFAASMNVSLIGELGEAAGEFVIEQDSSDLWQLWGAVQVNTGDELNAFLEPKGISLTGTARLSINTTTEDKTVTLRFPNSGATAPFAADEVTEQDITIEALAFTFFIQTQAEVSVPGGGARLFALDGTLFIKITPDRLELFVDAVLTLGGEGAGTFDGTLLLVVYTGLDGDHAPGIAGRATLIRSSGGGTPGVEFGAAFHLAFNTTGEKVTFLLPELINPIPTVDGPAIPFDPTDPLATVSYETLVTTADGDKRAIVIPGGAPPMDLSTPADWTAEEVEADFYFYIFGAGTITLVDQFELVGTFSIIGTLEGGSFELRMDFSAQLELASLGTLAAAGTLQFSSAGVLASIDLSANATVGDAGTLALTGRFSLEVNTTSATGQVTRLKLGADNRPLDTLETELVDIAPDTVRVFATADVSILGVMDGGGSFLIEQVGDDLTILWVGDVALAIDGTDVLTFATSGFIAVRDEGIAARVSLTLGVGGNAIPGLTFSAGFHLVLNTTGGEVSYELPDSFPTINGPDFTSTTGAPISYEDNSTGVRRIVVPGGPPPDAIGATWTSATTTDYLVIVGVGQLTLGSAFTLTGSFRIDVTGLGTTSVVIGLQIDAQISLDPIGTLAVSGELIISDDGVVASLSLAASASIGDAGGATSIAFTAAFALEINTTTSAQNVNRMVLDANFAPTGTTESVSIAAGKVRVFAGGTVTLGDFAAGRGAFVFERAGSGRLVFLWGGELTLTAGSTELFTFTTTGLVVIQSNGIAASVGLTIGTGEALPGFSFDASFYLILNTTGQEVSYLLPTGFPQVLGPNLATPGGAAISYETTIGGARAIKIPAGPPPAGTITATWSPVSTNDYFIVVGAGTLTLLDTLEFVGQFRLEITTTDAGPVVDLRLSASVTLTDLGDFTATAMLRLQPDGVVAAINLNTSSGNLLDQGGVTVGGQFFLELNTTSTVQNVQRPLVNSSGQIIPGQFQAVELGSEDWRIFVAATINLGGFVQGAGEVLIEKVGAEYRLVLSVRIYLRAGGTDLLAFDASGLVIVRTTGFAARLSLTIASNGIPGVSFSGSFALIANTIGSDVTFILPAEITSEFMGPTPTGGTESYVITTTDENDVTTRQLVIPGGAPVGDETTFKDWTPTVDGSYLVIVGFGNISLLSGTITLTGGFRIVVSQVSNSTQIDVAFDMQAVLGPLGTVDVSGGFRLTSAGIIAALNVDITTGEFPGFSLTATFTLEINTTGIAGSVPRFNYSSSGAVQSGTTNKPIAANTIRVFAAGSISIFSVVSGSGTFELTIQPNLVLFHADVNFSILGGVISASASIDALVYASGLVLNVTITVNSELTVIPGLSFKLEGSANLRINTTGSAKTLNNVSIAAGMRLSVFAKIDLASVIKVSGSIVFTFNQDGSWRVDVPNETTSSNPSSGGAPSGALTADFFGLATISVWGWFQSDGQFNVHVRGSISLGGGGTGLFGTVTFDAAYVKALNTTTGFYEYKLTLSASISGSAKLFGVTLGGFDASFSYDSSTGKLSVRVTVHFLFFSKSKTFTLGYFKLEAPPPFIPAGDLIDGKFWLNGADEGGDGVLYLNMGNRAANRSTATYLTDSEDETFLIRHVSGSPDDANGETIEIIGLGRKATYTGVKKIILLDTAGGENVLILGSDGPTNVGGVSLGGVNYVLSPFYANGGSGEDLIVYYGSGDRALGSFLLSAGVASPTYTQTAVMNGNGGEDYLEIGSLVTGTVWLTGGTGDDTLIGGINADTIEGGADNDRIVGGLGVDLLSGGSGIDVFYWAAGDGADSINGGGNSTDANWAATDAVPLNADTLVFIGTNSAETITLTSNGSSSATLFYVRGQAESVSLILTNLEAVDAHLGQGANTAVINDLLNSGITTLEFRVSATVPTIDALLRREALPTASVVAPDLFRFTGSSRDDEYVALSTSTTVQVTQKNAGATIAVATLHGITRPDTANNDILELKGAGGSDKLDAQGVTTNLIHVQLFGEAGTDRLTGTPFVDDLQGGSGNDTYTSGAGVDIFTDADGANTLIEVFDRDMSLFNNLFVSGTLSGFSRAGVTDASGNPVDANRPTGPDSILSSYSDAYAAGAEVENLASGGSPIFNQAILVGGAGNNVITVGTSTGSLSVGGIAQAVTPWTGAATLDNRSNGNAGQNGFYLVHLNGAAGATIVIADSAVTAAALLGVPHLDAGSSAYDELYVIGTGAADRITLRAGDGHTAGSDPRGLIYSGDPTNAATRTTITHRNLDHVVVRTLGGVDQIDAERTVVATVLESGDNDDVITLGGADAVNDYSSHERWAAVVINGGNGLDAITIGTPASATANTVNTIAGHVLVHGDAGTDTLVVNDSGDSADNLGHLTSSRLTGLGMGIHGITYRTLEDLTVNLGTGGDTFSIGSTHAGSTTLNANGGSDVIVVGSTGAATPGVLDDIAGGLFINGDLGGLDTFIALDNDDASANRGTLTSSTLTGLDMPVGITYQGFEALEVYLGTVADAFFIDTTHAGTTSVDGGSGDDVFRIKSIQGTTTITGAAGDDRFVVNVLDSTDDSAIGDAGTDEPPHGTETGLNGIGATLNLDGEADADRYWIYTANAVYSAAHKVSLINVIDSGGGGSNRMRIYGSDSAVSGDDFLVRRNFLASISATDSAERINYSGLNGGIRLDTRGGDDYVAFDDTGTTFDVNLGAGLDRLQVGQMFDAPRVWDPANPYYDNTQSQDPNVPKHPSIVGLASTVGSEADEITTFLTTQGWLSIGTSHDVVVHGDADADTMTVYHNSGKLYLYGDNGDDTFIVRAFALYSSQVGNPERELTSLSGGEGSDNVEYAENAPVAIDGGEGFDLVIVIGTEFSDRFVITEDGVYGAGLNVTFTAIERLKVYGAQGDDIFFILGTSPTVDVQVWGGLGSDTFMVGGVEDDVEFGTVPYDVSGVQGPLRLEGGDDPEADYTISDPLLYLTDSNPDVFVAPYIATLFDVEEEMIDRIFVNNSSVTSDTIGYLDAGRIWGLGMAATPAPGGIVYGGMEMMQVLLGSGSDRFQINRTHAGATEILGGSGPDIINVVSVSGHTQLDGGLGNDTFNIGTNHIAAANLVGHGTGSPQGVLDTIGAALVVIGGGGSDTLNADDSGDLTADVATVTGTTISGLNLRDAVVWTVELTVGFLGSFSLQLTVGATTVQTGSMETRDGASTMRGLLRDALGLNGGTPLLAGIKDVVVDVAGETFTIVFVTDETVAPEQISLAPSDTTIGIVAERSSLNLLQTITVNAVAGSFAFDITDAAGVVQQTLSFAWNVSSEDLRTGLYDAFKAILGNGNVFLRDFLVSKQGNTFFVAYQGQLKGTLGGQLALRSASPTYTITPFDADSADLTINAAAGTYRLLLGDGRISAPIAYDADAAAVASAIGHALGSISFTVVVQGGGFRLTFAGAGALGIDARNLVAVVEMAARTSGISYFGIATLNVDFGSAGDVLNVQGTSAGTVTNVWANGGDDKVFISSLAAEDLASAPLTQFLEGNLDRILGTLNLSLGDGRHKLMISDEAALVGDGSAAARARVTDQSQFTNPTASEVWITGLAPAGISYGASSTGNVADGVTLWTGWGADFIDIDGAHQRAGVRTTTSVNTGLGNDNVLVGLNSADGHFVLNAQGPYNAYLAFADADIIDGSLSTRSLILFGGQGMDTLKGGSADDFVFGDRAVVDYIHDDQLVARFGTGGPGDFTDGVERSIAVAYATDHTVGASDIIYAGAGDDVVIGSVGDDRLDGGIGHDLIFGDNAVLDRTLTAGNMATADPRYRTLIGGVLYDVLTGAPTQSATAFANPAGSPSWSDFDVTLVDHSSDIEATRGDLFGHDYIAGGAGRDLIFGGLGHDTIQGDGSIDHIAQLYLVDPLTGLFVPFVGTTPAGVAAGADVGAWRVDGSLYVRGSFETTGDGDDYIEGNGGDDTIFGGLGQDDIVGGSSSLFGLSDVDPAISRSLRPDGSDRIFGGAGTRTGRNDVGQTGTDAHARDSDTILGDNGNIYRAVDANGQPLVFGYDNYEENGLKIVPRVTEFLDYTNGGVDGDAVAAAFDIGAADEIHGEGGDDSVHGMLGGDALYGDGQDDDLIGGTGADWISGGAGQDGILGDDGRLWTSRNGIAEPLYGIAEIPTGGLNLYISTAGKVQQATINVSGALKKTALLEMFNLGADDYVTPGAEASNDILFGGLGGDWIHGGAGDDAISGAEALPEYFSRPVNVGNYLGWGLVRAGEFAAYDEYNPLKKVYVVLNAQGQYVFADSTEADAVQFILNFIDGEDDADDALFGDLGNDWIVGGRGRDHLYGGWGDDLLNADDLQDTAGGLNNAPDTSATYEDIAFGGAGRDILIGNTGGDRLIDWAGEHNSYIVPFAPFGLGTVSRALQPQIAQYLYALSGSDGADTTRAEKTGAAAVRNGEPFGELGLVLQQDFAWFAQTGAPDDPQPGNIPGGARDVLRSASFDRSVTDGFFIDSGTWNAKSGRVEVAPTMLGGDAVAIFHVGDALPVYYELRVTMNAVKPIAGYKANAYLIFDYQSATDFKFVGLNSSTNKMEMGHRNATGWIVDVQTPMQVKAGQDFNLTLAVNGTTATLIVNNKNVFSYAYAARIVDGVTYGLNSGLVGIGADNAKVSFDNFSVQVLPPEYTLIQTEDFNDGVDDLLGSVSIGTWSVSGGRLVLTPIAGNDAALRTADLNIGTNAVFQLQTRITTAGFAGIVFDYYGPNDYKFAGINVATKQVVIGHVGKRGLVIDATMSRTSLSATGTYLLDVSLKGTTVSVGLDGNQVLGFVFNAPVVDGEAGVFARGGTATFDTYLHRTNDLQFATALEGSFLSAAYAPLTEVAAATLTDAELRTAIDAVISWFAAHGRTAEEIGLLRSTQVAITSLRGLGLGWTDGTVVQIDSDAAGHGWSTGTAVAPDRMDLMSVIAHEFAHVLGEAHADVVGSPLVFMHDVFLPGVRVLPSLETVIEETDQAAGLRYAEGRAFTTQSFSVVGVHGFLLEAATSEIALFELSAPLTMLKPSTNRALGVSLD